MKESQLASLLSPILDQYGLELDSLDTVPAGKRRVLRITVDGDGPDGRGPTLDDIAGATKAISTALDSSDAVGSAAYTLEVSSRGLARPLTEPKHWRRNRGRLVAAHVREGAPVTGRIVASDDDTVRVQVVTDAKKKATQELTLAFSEITKALIQVEMNRSFDGGEEG